MPKHLLELTVPEGQGEAEVAFEAGKLAEELLPGWTLRRLDPGERFTEEERALFVRLITDLDCAERFSRGISENAEANAFKADAAALRRMAGLED
jgi:hypothetical protein